MTKDYILGYWVTDDPEVLARFLATVHQQYDELESQAATLDVEVQDLKGDWNTRWVAYWQRRLNDLKAVRETTTQTLFLFDRHASTPEKPIPAIMSAECLGYQFGLHSVESAIEEAGIRLTAYVSQYNPSSSTEIAIRQRQRVVKSLETVVAQIKQAVAEGRAKLATAQENQQGLFVPIEKGQEQ